MDAPRDPPPMTTTSASEGRTLVGGDRVESGRSGRGERRRGLRGRSLERLRSMIVVVQDLEGLEIFDELTSIKALFLGFKV